MTSHDVDPLRAFAVEALDYLRELRDKAEAGVILTPDAAEAQFELAKLIRRGQNALNRDNRVPARTALPAWERH